MHHIRPVVADDLDILPEIERQANRLFVTYGLAEQFAAVPTPIESLRKGAAADRLWVAVDETDHPVGFALACIIGDNAHLDELDVDPAHGQQGLGTALVETVCDWAKAAGYRAITLTTLRYIPWNAPWYQRLGFRVLEENELSAALRDLLYDEILRGLPADQRVAMRRNL